MKDGGVRLLTAADLEPGKQNCFSKLLIGWETAKNALGLVNPRGFACLRVIVRLLTDELLQDGYDQPMIVENPGSIVVCRAGNKVAFIKSWRNTGERLYPNDSNYVANVQEQGVWSQVCEGLGQWRWELPRGIPPTSTETSVEEIAIKAAKIETKEETGFTIGSARVVGRLNANPTFFAHSQYVVEAEIVSQSEKNPEQEENIGETRLFSPEEIRLLANGGQIDCVGFDDGMTLSALALAGVHF